MIIRSGTSPKKKRVFDRHEQEIHSRNFSWQPTHRFWLRQQRSSYLGDDRRNSLTTGVLWTVNMVLPPFSISPNGQFVAAGNLDTVVPFWDVNTTQLVEQLRGHSESVYSDTVTFTSDEKSGSLDKTLKYWDVLVIWLLGEVWADGKVGGSRWSLRDIKLVFLFFVCHHAS